MFSSLMSRLLFFFKASRVAVHASERERGGVNLRHFRLSRVLLDRPPPPQKKKYPALYNELVASHNLNLKIKIPRLVCLFIKQDMKHYLVILMLLIGKNLRDHLI